MSDTSWLKQVLADAKTAKESWPAWAKTSTHTALNSHPTHEVRPTTARAISRPAVVKQNNQNGLGLK